MLNLLAKRIFDFNVTMGWHSGPPDLARYLMNLHSEISEWWEAWRKGEDEKPCDKAEKMAAMELRPLTCREEESPEVQEAVTSTWFCHNAPMRGCAGIRAFLAHAQRKGAP